MTTYNETFSLTGDATITTPGTITINQAMDIFGAAGIFQGGGVVLQELMNLAGNAGLTLELVGTFIPSPCRYYYVASENRTLTVTC